MAIGLQVVSKCAYFWLFLLWNWWLVAAWPVSDTHMFGWPFLSPVITKVGGRENAVHIQPPKRPLACAAER